MFCYGLTTAVISLKLVSLAIFFIENFHILGLFIPEKSDAAVRRV
jgi:hypothetical protein